MKTNSRKGAVMAGAALAACLVLTGCAEYKSRRHLEKVAKGWCETIRASQVIPVYPLTEDLVPGDVFMVQTTIESQADLYRKRGFLALDDHRVRLPDLDYAKTYFDGYFEDAYGSTPHPRANRPGAGGVEPGGNVQLTEAPMPRAAFPTYSFTAKSGGGLSLALPIQGVPVGLNYLRSDRVNGSVTIADARTYGADEGMLYEALRKWAGREENREILRRTLQNARGTPIFLRVVSRVYLAGGVIVSLQRGDASGLAARGGSPPPLPMVANESINEDYTALLEALNQDSNALKELQATGGQFKYMAASESSVALAEAFDHWLVIGYLGFDVLIEPSGDLGVPVPTFQRLTGQIKVPAARVGDLTAEQKAFKVDATLLELLLEEDPPEAARLMEGVLKKLFVPELRAARSSLRAYRRASPEEKPAALRKLALDFKMGSAAYVSAAGGAGYRYERYERIFSEAFDQL